MAKYFFFDGEAAEAFSSATNHKDVAKAIRSILGCALAETAMDNLKGLSKDIDRELESIPGDRELKEIENQINSNDKEYGNSLVP